MDKIDVYHDGNRLHLDIPLKDNALRQGIAEALRDTLRNADHNDIGSWVPVKEMLYDVEAGADTLRTQGSYAFRLRDVLLAYGNGACREIGGQAKAAMRRQLETRNEVLSLSVRVQ